jgi:hypothetical protein
VVEESVHVITKVWPFATPVAVALVTAFQHCMASVNTTKDMPPLFEILQPWLYGLWQHFVYGMRRTKHVEHFRSWVISVSVTNIWGWAVPWLRLLVTGLSPWRPGFAPGSIHVGFVVDRHWDRFFSKFFGFPLSVYHSTFIHQTHHLGNA